MDFKQPGDLKVWDVDTGRQVVSVPGSTCAAFSPDGKRIVGASRDNTATVWDAETGCRVILTITGHTDAEVTCVAYSPDGKRIVSGSHDGTR